MQMTPPNRPLQPAQTRTAARRGHALFLGLCLVLIACVTNPITGKRGFVLFGVEQDTPLGLAAFQEVVATEKVIKSGPDAAMVRRVMDKLVLSAEDVDPGFEWDVVLIDKPETANAFCLPGGKMAVYSGILPITQTETGLAVVMGHEIGHAIARHGAQRVSEQMITQGAAEFLSTARPDWGTAIQSGMIGTQLLISLPFGRSQELDADYTGLVLMARAGYDPQEALAFWERMAKLSGGSGTPEFLSTHPSNQKRIAQIQELLPKALEIQKAANAGT